jgi:hemoglobin-like flavoprotein
MFPAAMDLQRRRFFEAVGRIADAQQSQADRDRLVPYLQELGRAHRKFGVRERHYAVTGGLVSPVLEALISAPDPGRHREIVLYYGARRHPDLYDLPALREYDLAP